MCEPVLEKPGTNVFLDDPCEFTMMRVFRSPRDLVWRLWTEPVKLARWWGPDSFSNPECEFELRAGAPYRIVMRGPDGVDFPLRGEVVDWSLHSRLVTTIDTTEHPQSFHGAYRSAGGYGGATPLVATQSVQFANHADGARVTVTLRFADTTTRDAYARMGAEIGWSESFDALDQLLDVALFRAVA
jgi:uncharacterized protein YndB with AHSA1/START domain